MAGLILIIAGAALIFYAIQHDKKQQIKWMKKWYFWVISIFLIVAGVLSINDSRLADIFASLMILVLIGLLYWRISDQRKKNLHGKKRIPHTLVTILLLVVYFAIAGSITNGLMTNETSNNTASDSNTSANTNNYVRLDGHKIYYTKSKKYAIKEDADTSWSAANAKVNSVTVYKTEKGYTYGSKRGKKAVQGLLAINVTVKALKDIQILMDSATVSIPSINEQHDIETKDDWDDLDKGISKTGTVYIPIYKLSNINNIKSLRFKFDCQQQSTDADDYDHTFDMTINLK